MTGEKLKALRKKLGLSLAQATRQVEVSSSMWCRWESGEQKIPEGAIKLFKLLNRVEDLPPQTRNVRVNVTTDKTIVSAVGYVRNPDKKPD